MRKVYYNWRKKAHALPPALFLLAGLPPMEAASCPEWQQRLRSQSQPLKTSSLDSHDGLTIAADPWLSSERYKTAFPKKTPYGAGVLAIKVTFRNDSDESIKIGINRIRLTITFDENNRQDLPALSSELLADAVLHPKQKDSSKPRIPLPIPASPGGRDKNWVEYKKLAEDVGLHDSVVAPHASIGGLLYFDLQGQFDLLSNAHLYIPDLISLEKNQTLMYFDIDLSHPAPQ
jgi:hypothetical protein